MDRFHPFLLPASTCLRPAGHSETHSFAYVTSLQLLKMGNNDQAEYRFFGHCNIIGMWDSVIASEKICNQALFLLNSPHGVNFRVYAVFFNLIVDSVSA